MLNNQKLWNFLPGTSFLMKLHNKSYHDLPLLDYDSTKTLLSELLYPKIDNWHYVISSYIWAFPLSNNSLFLQHYFHTMCLQQRFVFKFHVDRKKHGMFWVHLILPHHSLRPWIVDHFHFQPLLWFSYIFQRRDLYFKT
jgi:hypothetical protein